MWRSIADIIDDDELRAQIEEEIEQARHEEWLDNESTTHMPDGGAAASTEDATAGEAAASGASSTAQSAAGGAAGTREGSVWRSTAQSAAGGAEDKAVSKTAKVAGKAAASGAADSAGSKRRRHRVWLDSSDEEDAQEREDEEEVALEAQAGGGEEEEEEGEEEVELEDSSDEDAGKPSAASTSRPAVQLAGSMVVVPSSQYPGEQCSENDGCGWTAKVMAVTHGVVRLKFGQGNFESAYFSKATVQGWLS